MPSRRLLIGYWLAAALVALVAVMAQQPPSPTLSLMSIGYASGPEAAMPPLCPSSGLIFYVTTDTTPVHLWWCKGGVPAPAWRRVLNDVLPPVAAKPATIGALQADGSCSPRLPGFTPDTNVPYVPPFNTPPANHVQIPWTPCVLP
jgi:hypothetical protein